MLYAGGSFGKNLTTDFNITDRLSVCVCVCVCVCYCVSGMETIQRV
jgi:hypothetical protein